MSSERIDAEDLRHSNALAILEGDVRYCVSFLDDANRADEDVDTGGMVCLCLCLCLSAFALV